MKNRERRITGSGKSEKREYQHLILERFRVSRKRSEVSNQRFESTMDAKAIPFEPESPWQLNKPQHRQCPLQEQAI
jgi:hypothetical protein